MKNSENQNIFSNFTEEEINRFLKSAIYCTLVISNPTSIKYTLEKFYNDMSKEVEAREKKKNKLK